ncbi:MAG: hypothetical protein ACLFQL_00645 [Paracoccaceae bacterium]
MSDLMWQGGRATLARRIMDGLQALPREGAPAREAARMGFLEWVCSLPVEADAPQAAARAVAQIGPAPGASPAAALFLGYLWQAAEACASSPARRGGAAARRRLQ